MNNIVRSIVLIVVLMVTVLGFPKVSFGAENTEYISDVKIVSATSEEEAIRQLTEAGYIPVKNNLSNENYHLHLYILVLKRLKILQGLWKQLIKKTWEVYLEIRLL